MIGRHVGAPLRQVCFTNHGHPYYGRPYYGRPVMGLFFGLDASKRRPAVEASRLVGNWKPATVQKISTRSDDILGDVAAGEFQSTVFEMCCRRPARIVGTRGGERLDEWKVKLIDTIERVVRRSLDSDGRTTRLCLLILVVATAWWLTHH